MTVTKIMPLDKKRSRVWLDEEFAFVLYKGELRRYKLEEGSDIDASVYDEIKNVVLPKRAKLRTMNLLLKKSYSEHMIRQKLLEGYYPDKAIDEAIEYVKKYGYVDDLRLSEEYIRVHLSDKSRKRIEQDLINKGIDKNTIHNAFDNTCDEGFEVDELSMAKELLTKRGYYRDIEKMQEMDYTEISRFKLKHYSFLARKGFKNEIIRQVMNIEESY